MSEDYAYESEKERRKKRLNHNIDMHIMHEAQLRAKIGTLIAMDTSIDEEKKFFKKFEKKNPIAKENPFGNLKIGEKIDYDEDQRRILSTESKKSRKQFLKSIDN